MNTRTISAVAVLAVVASACGSGAGRPKTLVVGYADTVIVNRQSSSPIATRVLDAEGAEVANPDSVRFRWVSGDSLDLTTDGHVTCGRRADAVVSASAGELTTRALIRCRPVKSVKMAGPVQFLVGDSAQKLNAVVTGLDGKPVDLVAGSVSIMDRSVAGAEGMRIVPRAPGGTLVTLSVGDETATASVHVYQSLDALVHLKPEQQFVGVHLSLRSGELRRWDLPPGAWMLTMTPYEDARSGLRLTVDGANCTPNPISPRRITCYSKTGSQVTVSHPSKVRAPEMTGRLLVRRIAS